MAKDQNGKRPLREGYEPRENGSAPVIKEGYTPIATIRPSSKPPQGGSGLMPRPAANKK